MGRTLTNNVSLTVGRQSGLDADPASYTLLEPENITNFGSTITTVSRNPISPNRQQRKGTITDLDSAVEFEHDMTMDVMLEFTDAFMFSNYKNDDLNYRAAIATNSGFTLPAGSSTGSSTNRLLLAGTSSSPTGPGSLFYASGYSNPINNGLKLAASYSASSRLLTTNGVTTTSEESSPTTRLEFAGVRAASGDIQTTTDGSNYILTSDNSATTEVQFNQIGLTVGQAVQIDIFGNTSSAFAPVFGYVTSIEQNRLALSNLQSAQPLFNISGNTVVDLYFGRFARNVPVNDSDYREQFLTFEASYPNLANPSGNTEYEYAINNLCNSMTINLPLTDRATVSFGFIGTDAMPPSTTRKSMAAGSPLPPSLTAAFNTTQDTSRIVIQEADETGLTTDFRSVEITLNNNVSPEKVIGRLGARYMNTGNFDVTATAQAIFTDSGVIRAIRNNDTLAFLTRLQNDDGAIAIRFPSMTLGGGGREYPRDESVLVNAEMQSHADVALDTSIGISFFPFVAGD